MNQIIINKKKITTVYVLKFFPEEIKFIFDNRKDFRTDLSKVPLSKLELFSWMKKKNLSTYAKFKDVLSKKLKNIAESGIFTETEVKVTIAYFIRESLLNDFICL